MIQQLEVTHCPDCGTQLAREPWAAGLCPHCMMLLAVEGRAPAGAEDSDGDDLPTLQFDPEAFAESGSLVEGQVLGSRYRVGALLGRGGMGEVWWALDLKLRVDVALKALRKQLLQDKRALEALRQEVRSAREVISPNVCRVFDLVELEGQELVSMEYIDGITLADVLKMRAPLDLTEAREIAAQFLAGLEAIHEAGLVHRDVKPENIMITRSGRAVVMDFGIAKSLAERSTGTVSGTPAYMAPEQARGESVTPRADVFSAGIVLAEMIAPDGLARHEDRVALWEGMHREPPQVPESPWAPVLRQAVAQQVEGRFADMAALARALEEVALRVEGDDQLTPYPGLASFSAQDAEYFFGRELEVEEMWKKLRRPQLLGLIGPSGAGKSSFLHAGLLPVTPSGWRAVITVPGSQPVLSLARVLSEELSGEGAATEDEFGCEDPDSLVSRVAHWRQNHDEVLIILDQFEELFTQNPAEVQSQFSELLGRLALETDAHVLLSMRDDFLFYCSGQPALTPMFSELTPLRPPSGTALRRALVQPALKCGYRFEDEALVDEMVGEVGDGRGALPMLAFAAARLWDLRDREQGLLTWEAYEHIGGVTGALAQHAESTLEAIGQERVPLVRELFRNLITAQGTRAARDREGLLSVFQVADNPAPRRRSAGERGARSGEATETEGPTASASEWTAAGRVLDKLIDARLLTSYEIPAMEDEAEPQQKIEIIHESLLSNWPRLVRWQTQDADSAQLRDQVRQAAQMWEERGRSEDLLWTGTSFGEYQLWRERYEGGLSRQEEEFAAAMVEKAGRARRRRRAILAGVIAVMAVGLSIVLGLWFQAEQARRQAETETRRAEAGKLVALARLEHQGFPTGQLAYVRRSLELADTAEARHFALEILWRAPVARLLEVDWNWLGRFSPDGRWLAVETDKGIRVATSDGEISDPLGRETGQEAAFNRLGFTPDGDMLIRVLVSLAGGVHHFLGVERWRLPELTQLEYLALEGRPDACLGWTDRGLPLMRLVDESTNTLEVNLIPSPPFPEEVSDEQYLDRWAIGEGDAVRFNTAGTRAVCGARDDPKTIYVRSLVSGSPGSTRRVGEVDGTIRQLGISPDGSLVGTALQEDGLFYVWSTAGESETTPRILRGNRGHDPLSWPEFSPDNRHLVMVSSSLDATYLWDLEIPLDGDPVVLSNSAGAGGWVGTFDPTGRWLASFHGNHVALWPVQAAYARSISLKEDAKFAWIGDIAFSADSSWIGSCSQGSGLHLWPLAPGVGGDWIEDNMCTRLAFRPDSDAVVTARDELRLRPADGSESPRVIGPAGALNGAVAFDPTGRFLASANSDDVPMGEVQGTPLTVLDLATGATVHLDPLAGCEAWEGRTCRVLYLGFAFDGSLFTAGPGGVRRWSLEDRSAEWIVGPAPIYSGLHLSRDGRYLLTRVEWGPESEEDSVEPVVPGVEVGWFWTDLESGEVKKLRDEIGQPSAGALHPSGQIYALAADDGSVEVGRVSGGPIHLLVGHDGIVSLLRFSPDGRWLASASGGELKLWAIPDLDKPPFHTLPLDALLAKLDTLTNVKAVESPDAVSGWELEIGPFPGWQEVPEW